MLPAECGLVSRQHPLIDTLPNAVELKYKSSSPLPGTYARFSPHPISTPCLPFAFTPICLFYLCRSQSLATSPLSFNSLSPSYDALHAISYLFTSPSSAPLCQPVSNCIFPLHLAISLVSFLLCFSLIPCIFLNTFMCYYIFSSPCPCFSLIQRSFHVLSISVFTCAEVGLNLYRLISS